MCTVEYNIRYMYFLETKDGQRCVCKHVTDSVYEGQHGDIETEWFWPILGKTV